MIKVGDKVILTSNENAELNIEYEGLIVEVIECDIKNHSYLVKIPDTQDKLWFNEEHIMRIDFKDNNNQSAKADAGKLRLTLVPRKIIFEIAKIREYGCKKYKEPDNWKRVEIERYRDAAYRHFMAYLEEPNGVDKESGLPHLSHLACNIAFLCELEELGD